MTDSALSRSGHKLKTGGLDFQIRSFWVDLEKAFPGGQWEEELSEGGLNRKGKRSEKPLCQAVVNVDTDSLAMQINLQIEWDILFHPVLYLRPPPSMAVL